MKKPIAAFPMIISLIIGLDASLFCQVKNPDSPSSSIVGIWQGTLEVPGAKLRIVFRVSKNPDGSWTTLLDSPDQGAKDIPVGETVLVHDSLFFRVPAIMGGYEGQIQPDGLSAAGSWKQGGMSLPLALKKTDQAPTVNRPQEPKPPFPYLQEDVTFRNPGAGIDLAGTLTLPEKGGPFPAVVLVTGSGPEDRDEAVFGHRPFFIISDYLTRQGIAVLRYDDRGVGKSKGDFGSATTEDFAADALAAVEFLKTRKEINHAKIGVIGHSEGGLIAPIVANESKDAAFVVLLAGPGMIGKDLLCLQSTAISRAAGTDEKTIAKSDALQKRMFSVLMQEKDSPAAEKKLHAVMNEAAKGMGEEEKTNAGLNDAAIDRQVKQMLTPWFRFFLAYDPQTNLSKLKCPALAIWGAKDLQVPPKENMPLVEQALKKAGNTNYKVEILPNLNHLFQNADTGLPMEYARIEETFAPAALTVVGDWIRATVR